MALFRRRTTSESPPSGATASAVSLREWRDAPQMSPGAPEPAIVTTEFDLVVAYRTNLGDFAVVRFMALDQATFGYPNDEALPGHLLYPDGLSAYAIWEIANSPRIRALDAANNVAFPGSNVFAGAHHWIITFKDSTLEVVAAGIRFAGAFPAESALEAIHRHLAQERLGW